MKDEKLKPRFGYQRDITLSSNVIMFLAEYIHGIENGKRDDQTILTLRNATDHFTKLLENNGYKVEIK